MDIGPIKFDLARRDGAPKYAGLYTLTPQTLMLNVRFGGVGYAWVWPIGVIATRAGMVQRIPIIDATRWALFSIWFGVAFAGLVIWLSRRRESRASTGKKEQ